MHHARHRWQRLLASTLACLLLAPTCAFAQQPAPPASPSAQSTAATQSTAAPTTAPGAPSAAGPTPQEPAAVGTAAAPYERRLGVPASRPAGAVIAPARQRRTRALVIKVGLIAAAAVAVGTVVALSESSSSRPH